MPISLNCLLREPAFRKRLKLLSSARMSTPSKPRQWGVTAPISTASPTPHELQLTETLVEALKGYNLFESDQEARKR
jgi:hypothetical protein